MPRAMSGTISRLNTAVCRTSQSNRVAVHESVIDAVDGSSTRRASAMDVGAVKAPTIRRSYLCKRSRQSVWISRSRFFRSTASTRGECSYSPAAQATLRDDLLPEAIAVPGRYRSLRLVASLVARTPSDRPFCAVDAAGLREALCEADPEVRRPRQLTRSREIGPMIRDQGSGIKL